MRYSFNNIIKEKDLFIYKCFEIVKHLKFIVFLIIVTLVLCYPTVTLAGIIYPTDDTYVEQDNQNNNNGSSNILVTGDPSGYALYEIYIQFDDLSNIPSASQLNSAKLWLRLSSVKKDTGA